MSWQSLVDSAYITKVKNNRTVQVRPNRDERDTYIFAGSSEEEVLNQLSLFFALRQLIYNDFNFDEWADSFEMAYPGRGTGFEESKPYGKPVENRPRITVLPSEGLETKKDEILVKFRPDRNGDEFYIFNGTKSEVRQSIQLFYNNWLTRKEEEDSALNAYYPLDEYLRAKPRDYIALQVWFTPKKDWSSSAKPANWSGLWKTYHYTIPAINLPLSYESLKTLAGGEGGITIGKHTARGYLGKLNDGKSLKGATQLVVSASSSTGAESELRRIANYSQLEILKISTNEETFARNGSLKPNAMKMYPAWVVFMSSKLIDNAYKRGKITLQGKHITKRMRVPLNKRPLYYDELMSELLED